MSSSHWQDKAVKLKTDTEPTEKTQQQQQQIQQVKRTVQTQWRRRQ
jgi:hypothetical protein